MRVVPRKPNAIVLKVSHQAETETAQTSPCPERRDRVLGLLVRPGSADRSACTGRPSNHSLSGALTPYRMGGLVSGGASRLDALSVYPGRGRLSGDATGVTTGPP